MAIFSDGPPASQDDLTQQDSFLLGVAATEGIDVTTKLTLAYAEITVELAAIFAREASIYAPVLGQAPLDINHLAVTPALKNWHVFLSLELVYRDAYYNQLNDRYRNKWIQFENLSRHASGRFIETGASLVVDPLPVPLQPPTILQVAPQAGGTVYLSSTWVNAAGQESSPSTIAASEVPDGNILLISAPVAPSNAIAWNLYTNLAPSNLTRQNATPMALADTWQFIFPGVNTGPSAGFGQTGDVIRDLPRRIMRG